jgi:hypothetical protein
MHSVLVHWFLHLKHCISNMFPSIMDHFQGESYYTSTPYYTILYYTMLYYTIQSTSYGIFFTYLHLMYRVPGTTFHHRIGFNFNFKLILILLHIL